MIASNHIGQAIESARRYLADHPEEARYTDSAASAVVESGLRCRVEGPEWRDCLHRHAHRRRRRGDGSFARLVAPRQPGKL